MRKGAVLTCLTWITLLGVGASLSATSLSGRWATDLLFRMDDAIAFSDSLILQSEIATELHMGDWTFANVTSFASNVTTVPLWGMGMALWGAGVPLWGPGSDGLSSMKFAAAGPFGVSDVISSMTFFKHSSGGDCILGMAAARATIGGLDLWSGATLWELPVVGTGVGIILGANGAIGNVEIYTDMAFNMDQPVSSYIFREGLDEVWDRLMFCNLLGLGGFTCELLFSSFSVSTTFPIGCVDVKTWIGIVPTGFSSFESYVSDVDLGFGGLAIDQLKISYRIAAKTVTLDLGLNLADIGCVTPYFSLIEGASTGQIDGLSLDALEIVSSIGDVTVIVSELFAEDLVFPTVFDSITFLAEDARIYKIESPLLSFSTCRAPVDANEAIGLEVNRPNCCGSEVSLGIYTFFDTNLAESSLFDWKQTKISLKYEDAFHRTVSAYIYASQGTGPVLGISFEYLWGDLTIFGPDWMNPCCRGVLTAI